MAGLEKLRLLYLVLCDGFSTDPMTGKKTFLGVFDRIMARSLPSAYPSMTIAVSLEGGQALYELGAVILDPSSAPVFHSPTIPVTPRAPYRREDVIMQVNNLLLSRAGRYEIQVVSGGVPLGSYPLFVEESGSLGSASGE